MSTVYLPKSLEPKANRYAEDHVEEIDGLRKGSKGYDKAFEKAKYAFCLDFVESCGGIEKNNPTSQKAPSIFFVFDDVLFETSKFGSSIKSDQKQATLARLRGDIVQLAHIWLENTDGMIVKSSNKSIGRMATNDKFLSDLEYRGKKKEGEGYSESWKPVNVRRFRRAFIIAALIAAIESVFKTKAEDLNNLIDDALADVPDNQLNSLEAYKKLGLFVKEPLLRMFSSIDIIRAGREGLSGKSLKS